jgi:lysophospholipase L1-like esterase
MFKSQNIETAAVAAKPRNLVCFAIVTAAMLSDLSLTPPAIAASEKTNFRFDFGSGSVESGYTQVTQATTYTKELGYGFRDASAVTSTNGATPDALRGDCCTSDKPFLFDIDLPEGNYNVTVILGDPKAESEATVKAESRRLMLENVHTAAGKFESRTFTVNIRTPKISSGDDEVRLKPREKGPPLVPDWDDKLTLEFNGKHPCVCALEIAKTDDAITVYIAGDSTVTDQPDEPWAGWGQLLPRFFKQGIAVANHAESGLALSSFKGQKRLDKILSTMKPGDYLFIQFGHNDQKEKGENVGPFTTYKDSLKFFVEETRKHGGNPVLVTSMERRRFDKDGKPTPTLTDFAEAVRQAGKENNVPVIDLNAMSLKLYEALGQENSTKAFVHYPANTFLGQDKELKDDTHHNVYGGYELAKCVIEGIKASVPALKEYLADGLPAFDPSKPDPVESVNIPPSPFVATEKPAGS